MIIEYSGQSLKELTAHDAVLVEFYAEWCGPCNKMETVLHEISQAYPELQIVKINVDQYDSLADQYKVSSIPSIFFVKQGKNLESTIGAITKPVLENKLEQRFGLKKI